MENFIYALRLVNTFYFFVLQEIFCSTGSSIKFRDETIFFNYFNQCLIRHDYDPESSDFGSPNFNNLNKIFHNILKYYRLYQCYVLHICVLGNILLRLSHKSFSHDFTVILQFNHKIIRFVVLWKNLIVAK